MFWLPPIANNKSNKILNITNFKVKHLKHPAVVAEWVYELLQIQVAEIPGLNPTRDILVTIAKKL